MRVIRQRKDWDCGVAALAMLLDIPYGDVAAYVREAFADDPCLRCRGLKTAQVQAVAKHFKLPLTLVHRRRRYLEGATGILGFIGGVFAKGSGHWVVLRGGTTVIDPDDGDVCDLQSFIDATGGRPTHLLRR